ncbi:hypothetical protein [Bacillus sp. B1-b2]|uniref:hypothetical protein n=1 Tax=Bacillus sp. B1-b2 TaxID=2653201 RepID=UPI00126219A0|nr:hypothetical protein [Bacillus sp. B1-b2]KAB7662870.1 hypothetical protein F9279_24585 [Bacillus sp. B1-b2]
MKIVVRRNALELYINQHTDTQGHYTGKDNWEIIMKQIAGKELEVDTESLFKYEFNTKEIIGVSKRGIRISDLYVEQILDDARIGKARCDYCEHTSNALQYCTHCGRTDCLEPFLEEE